MTWKRYPHHWLFVRGIHWLNVLFPHKTSVTPSFDNFFVFIVIKLLNKHLNCRWVDTPHDITLVLRQYVNAQISFIMLASGTRFMIVGCTFVSWLKKIINSTLTRWIGDLSAIKSLLLIPRLPWIFPGIPLTFNGVPEISRWPWQVYCCGM